MPDQSDDFSQYRRLLLESLKRLEDQSADTKNQVHEIKVKMGSLHSDVQRHNNHDERISVLENSNVKYNTILSIISAALIGAWVFILNKVFN